MGSSSVTPFTGSSAYASQLEQVISTAVSQASAPITQLQNEQTSLSNQQSEMQTLSADFAALQTAVTQVNSAAQSAMSAQVSNTQVASATLESGASAGTYSVTVTSMGAQANTISDASLPTVTDPSESSISTSSTYTLTVGDSTYTINPASQSLSALAAAINSSGANVQATVVNVGGSSNPDYLLSVQSLNYSPDAIQLNDGTENLLDTITPGAYVQYQVNGEPSTPINSTTQSAEISPGVNVNFLSTGTADITVAPSTSSISSALSSFATAYNDVVTELQKNRGQNGGALSGQSIVYDLQNQLQNLGNYTASDGTVSTLSDLGLSFDSNGQLDFDQTALADVNPQAVLAFLGSTSTNGFLATTTNVLNGIADPTSGTLSLATQNVTNEISQLGTEITDKQQQVTQLQNTLTTQMASADAAISALEQQVDEITDLFSSEQQAERNITG